jgi:hypothetical protein
VNRAWARRPAARAHAAKGEPGETEIGPGTIVSVFATFHFVCFAWIFFRAPTFAHATLMLERMGKLTFDSPNLAPKVLAILALGFLTHFMPRTWFFRIRNTFVESPAVVQGVALAVFAYVLHFASGVKAEPFIYGQF